MAGLSLSLQLEPGTSVTNSGPSGTPTRPLVGATGVHQYKRIKKIPIGYSKKVLNRQVEPRFLCVRCDNVLREPVQNQCGHRYCRDCYISLVQSQPTVKCAACIKEGEDGEAFPPLTLDRIYPDHAIRKDMSSKKAECGYPGCDWTGLFGNFLKHVTECRFQERKCHCGMLVGSNKMDDHKTNECPLRTIKCLYCNIDIVAQDQAEHDKECESYPETCNACSAQMQRSKTAAHVDPINGDCKNRKCPFGCEIVNTPKHQEESAIDHLNAVLGKFLTLKFEIEQGLTSAEAMTQRLGELERKVIEFQALDGPGRDSGVPFQGDASAPHAGNASVAALTEKQATVESIVAVINRQLEKIVVDHNGLKRQHRLQTEGVDALQRKIISMERSLSLKGIALVEQDLKIQALEETSFDGVLVWPITDFSRKRSEATSGRVLSICSPSFFTSRSGYKMCCRLYLNGDGIGKATHMSLFFVVMKGQYDAILPWPFRQKVTLMLLDQGNTNHLIDAFRPDPTSTSFRRPVSDMNIASGCPLFFPLSKLEERKPVYVRDDSIFIKVIVDQQGL